MTDGFKNTLAWLLIGTIGVFIAMNWASASFTGADYLPAGNDSFYHARRILDTWQDPGAFFEFDPRIHVPEGSWITWPWLYDYSVARVLRILVPPESGADPMKVLVYLPVLWAYVTVGLVLAIAINLGLSRPLQILAGLAAALLPLNQVLHGVGRIDHHFMEYTFVLLTLLGGLRWLKAPRDRGRAALLGLTLGLAVGFHNGMFVLQIPVLGTLFILWMRREMPPASATAFFAGFLMLGTLLVVVPSQPFLNGEFLYYLLSGYHLYIALCTALIALFMAGGEFSWTRLAIMAVAGLVMLVPIVGQMQLASDFFAHRGTRLSVITEARSLLTMAAKPRGIREISGIYSYLVFGLPVIFFGLLFWLIRTRDRCVTFFAIFSLFGLTLLVQQFRFHYYGSFALYLPCLVAAQGLARRFSNHGKGILLATTMAFVAAFYLPIHGRLSPQLTAGLDAHYNVVKGLMPELKERCRKQPGVVLAWNDVGHYIRFHTECSVIANNFLLTPQHSDKVREIDQLVSMTVDQLLDARPDIKYILAHYPTFVRFESDGGIRLLNEDDLTMANYEKPLFIGLLSEKNPETAFPRLEFVRQVVLRMDGQESVAARLFAVRDPEAGSGASTNPSAQGTRSRP
jgi:hypothetical protein